MAPSEQAASVNERKSVHVFRLPDVRRHLALPAGAAVVCLMLAGCVHRRLTIRSDPPGALVLLDDREIGFTPVSTDFTYYGTREIKLIKDGYETRTVLQPISAPWYQVPPLDFFSENLWPFRVTDRHAFSYELQPQVVVPTEELLQRGNALRSRVQINP